MSISQREARRLKKRVGQLEQELRATWNEWRLEDWPGTLIASMSATAETRAAVATARKLQCRVIATTGDNDRILFFAKRVHDEP